MDLKRYQKEVIRDVRLFLNALDAEYQAGNARHATTDAWDACRVGRDYRNRRRNGLGNDLPNFCIKVPTGGGKTLLATQILGEIYKTILKDRRGAGLVLWVVPSDQIYKDTLRRLRDRNDFYRESLEFALSRRIEIWEKHEIARLTPAQLAANLNILIVKLQGTNRQDKESLKFFADSGGNIVQHFPPEDEPDAQKQLLARFPNLDMIEADESSGRYLAKTSVGSLVRLCQPAVVLDEGHKATSDLARTTIEGFNPSIVVELSATPTRHANVLVAVTGKQLLDEEMIKLPINVANSNQNSWKNVLTKVRDRREELARAAAGHFRETEQYIRPIVLVQVERTGKDQREAKLIHAEDVREYLMERLGVDDAKIAVKTSEKDGLEDQDLLDPGCAIEWIITKAALQEGWDCPFAYILVSLNNTRSQQSMTQLVGRVLRQPYQKRSCYEDLNQSYVYCLRQTSMAVLAEIKRALEKEGYEGDAASVVDGSRGDEKDKSRRTARIQADFTRHYRRPFEGRIFIPRFCVREEDEVEALDYYRHLLAMVKVDRFEYDGIDWDLSQEMEKASEQFYRISLGESFSLGEEKLSLLETDEQVKLWLVSAIGYDWLSAKELKAVVERVCERLPALKGRLALVKGILREKIAGFIQHQTDFATERRFRQLHKSGKLLFYLQCVHGRFELPAEVTVMSMPSLQHNNGNFVQRSLYDYTPDNLNEYEKAVALCLDDHPQVLWWYRNIVGHSQFSVQGYRRSLIYPDFVVQFGDSQLELPIASVLVLESKGKQLKGNEDTSYKRDVASVYQDVGRQVTWQELGEDFAQHKFRFQVLDEGEYADRDWRDDLQKMLKEA